VVAVEPARVPEGDDGPSWGVAAVTLSSPSSRPVTVAYAVGGGTASADDIVADHDSGTLTFAPGETGRAVRFAAVGDDVDEGDETFAVTLSDPVGATLGPASAPVTIVDDDATGAPADGPAGDRAGPGDDPAATPASRPAGSGDRPTVSVADITVPEGNSGTTAADFTVSLSGPASGPVSVAYATAAGSATAGADFRPVAGTLHFAPGDTARTVSVPVVGDSLAEPPEDFRLTLGRADGATVAGGPGRAVITDDDVPRLDIADATLAEGDAGTGVLTFAVTLTPSAAGPLTVGYATRDGSATAGDDYGAVRGTLTFNRGERVHTVEVPVTGDTTDRATESFEVGLSTRGAGVRLGRATATGTIIDDDGPPGIGSSDVTVTEPTGTDTAAVFPVRLSGARSFPVSVHYETVPGTATPDVDFRPVSGDLTFGPGDEEHAVAVPVRGDRRAEAAETLRLHLSSTGGGVLPDPDAVATIVDDDESGYVLAGTDGAVFSYGGAGYFGGAGGRSLPAPVVAVAALPSGGGYWLAAADGEVLAFGAAPFLGSAGDRPLSRPIVGMAATPSGDGYWLVSTDGGIFAFGDARFYGSMASQPLNKPIVAIAPTGSGRGYWLLAADGGIFSFGDARFVGSVGDIALNRPIVGLAPTPSGAGYRLVASDGGIFAFGDAGFFGSTGARRLNQPIVALATSPSGAGYWLVAADGGIFAFGDAPFLGSTGSARLHRPVIGMAAL
ncbi:MAG TPA: Calx-beta domain-containing protein, partial [Acidimicrobiia bacterium]|nr:Calx-beta domain-containing protein [Acidimicrobiia bacterium]